MNGGNVARGDELKRLLWDKRVRELYDERHSILVRKRANRLQPTDLKQLRFIERQINWYEMKYAAPEREVHCETMRKLNALIRRARLAIKRAHGAG